VGSVARKYIVDIASGLPTILCEIDPCDSCAVTNKYYYANAQILKQDNSKGSYYYIHDRLGSVRLLVNDIGDVNNFYTYNPYGEDLASECSESVENNFKYTGQWYDSEIGQYYLRARMYDPALMRFTARDPVKGKYQNPLTLHQYLYCINDPINWTDTSGRAGLAVTDKLAAAVVVYVVVVNIMIEGLYHSNDGLFDAGLALGAAWANNFKANVNSLVKAYKEGSQEARDGYGKIRKIAEDVGVDPHELWGKSIQKKKKSGPRGGTLKRTQILK